MSMALSITNFITRPSSQFHIPTARCCSDSKPKRGFAPQQDANKVSDGAPRRRKSASQQSGTTSNKAPWLSSPSSGIQRNVSRDLQFEERLEALKRSTVDQKKAEQTVEFGKIEYDAPVKSAGSTIELGTKIGLGVAVVVFGFIFSFGDLIPNESFSDNGGDIQISEEDKATLQARLQQFEAKVKISPEDSTALEGEAATLAELGEYTRAASLLEDIVKKKPNSPDAFRLLGEVKYNMKDYEGSVAAYQSSAQMYKSVNFEVLRGLTNALLAAKRPDEAVQFLLVTRERLTTEKLQSDSIKVDDSAAEDLSVVDPIQVELLLGKAYSDWGHVTDAVSVYDRLIANHPDDFRGYLAKGIILKENGNAGAAERMFIQARFFAPQKAKFLVDRYSKR